MAGMVVGGARTPQSLEAVYDLSGRLIQQGTGVYAGSPAGTQGPAYSTLGAGSTINTTGYVGGTGANAYSRNETITPNLLPQEHAYAMAQQAADAKAKQDQARLQAQLAAQAESRRLAAIKGLMPGAGGPGAPGAPAGPAYDENAARDAAFGRAKEQAGQTAQASLKALEDVMAGRGLHGSTIEGNLTGDVLTGGMHELNDLVRSQTISDTNRAGQVADRNYQGSIVTRGQDMDYMRSLLASLSSGGGLY